MLRLADPSFGDEALDAIGRVLASGRLTQGPVVAEFEAAVAELCGVAHGVATTSATTALELSLAALDIGPGDEVIAADFTYPATGNAVLHRGATLKLADVDIETYCITPESIQRLLSDRTRAVITVDVFGLPADYTTIEPLLAERGVALVCDAACSLGAAIGDRRSGAFGALSCFSFHPRKSLTTGEGGMVMTDDAVLAARLRRLRNHGSERVGWRAKFLEPGFNYRMSDINAALGLLQAPRHLETVARRRELAARLGEHIEQIEGVTPQRVPDGWLHPYQAYVVTLDPVLNREATIAELFASGVESTLGTYALHLEPAFAERGCAPPQGLPNSRALTERTLALPLQERLAEADIDYIAEMLGHALASSRAEPGRRDRLMSGGRRS